MWPRVNFIVWAKCVVGWDLLVAIMCYFDGFPCIGHIRISRLMLFVYQICSRFSKSGLRVFD